MRPFLPLSHDTGGENGENGTLGRDRYDTVPNGHVGGVLSEGYAIAVREPETFRWLIRAFEKDIMRKIAHIVISDKFRSHYTEMEFYIDATRQTIRKRAGRFVENGVFERVGQPTHIEPVNDEMKVLVREALALCDPV